MVARRFVRAACACVVAVGLVSPSVAAVAKAPYPPVLSDVCTTDIDAGGVVTVVVGNFCSSNTGSGGNIAVTVPVDMSGGGVAETEIPVRAEYEMASVEALLQQLVSAQSGRVYSAELDVEKILPTKAGRYPVKFTVDGQVYTRTYTVGKAVNITGVKLARTSKGVRVTGKTTKSSKVKVEIKRGSKVVSTKTVATNSSSGRFSYLKTLPKGKYAVTITYVANNKYFGNKAITKTFTMTS
jgi:hypothetical protein